MTLWNFGVMGCSKPKKVGVTSIKYLYHIAHLRKKEQTGSNT